MSATGTHGHRTALFIVTALRDTTLAFGLLAMVARCRRLWGGGGSCARGLYSNKFLFKFRLAFSPESDAQGSPA